jgi:hypothetical protein
MSINGTLLETCCKALLQKNLTLEIKNKTYKQGKLLIFQQKNFYLTFILENSKSKNEKVEIPIPFDVENHMDDGLVYFDYRIKTLSKYCPEIETNLLFFPNKSKNNKFLDTILTINAK